MNNVVFKLAAVLGIDTSEFDNGLNNAKTSAHTFGGAIGKGLATAAKIGVEALGAATAAVGAFAASSVKTGSDFDKSMSQVAATMGMTVEQLSDSTSQASKDFKMLRDFALETGRTTAFSAQQASEALNYMALAGYDVQTSMEMLPNVLNLAASGNMELARASDMVTDAATAFGLVLEDGSVDIQRTTLMVDEMAKAASTGNTSVEQLGDAFLTVGGLAKELNGGMLTLADGTTKTYDNVQELEIALTAMANAGIKGSEAGTHMRNMLLKLASPSKEGAEAFERLGITVFDAEGNMRSISDIMKELGGAMDKLTQEEKLQAISDIFNTRDTAAAEALMAAVGQDWDKIGASILNASGAAEKMAKTQLNNLAGDTTLFKSALEGAKIVISDALTPTLRQFVQFGTDGISKLSDAFTNGGLSGAMTAFQEVLSSGLAMIIQMLPDVILIGGQVLGALGQGLIDNLPLLLQTAVQIVEQLVNALLTGIPSALNGIASVLPDLISKVTDLLIDLATAISNPSNLTMFIQSALAIILALAQGLLTNLPRLIETIPVIIENLVTALVENLPTILETVVELLGMIAETIIENLPLIVAAGIQITFSLMSGIVQMIPSIVASMINLIGQLYATLIASLPKFIENGVKIVKSIIEGIVSMLQAWIKAAIDLVDQFIKALVNSGKKLFDAGVKVVNFVKDGIMSMIQEAVQWGADLIDGFISGITSKIGALKSTISGVAGSIASFIHFSEPDVGPLSNFHTYAPDMMDLFMKGIRDNKKKLTNTVADAFDFQKLIETPAMEYSVNGGSRGVGGGFNQVVNVYSPEALDPSEVARETRNATRDMVLELRGI